MWISEEIKKIQKQHRYWMPCDKYPRHLPLTRAECEHGIRPCPYISCRYHIGSNVTKSGSIQYRDPEGMKHTCTLDLVNVRAYTYQEIANVMGITKQAVEQIVKNATTKLAARKRLRDSIPDP